MGSSVRTARSLSCAPVAGAAVLIFWFDRIHPSTFQLPPRISTPDSKGALDTVPPTTPEERRRVDSEIDLWETRKRAPVALNFPVLIVQLPYILVSPTKREWVPRGMLPDVWRALSWPFAGMFFWWFLGRGFEALFAARRSVARPRISWGETAFALILFGAGILTLIGLLTSTPDDRRDVQFMALIVGGLLWGLLATATIAARFLQLQIAKASAAAQSAGNPSKPAP